MSPSLPPPENFNHTLVVLFVFSITTREVDRQGMKCALTSFFSTQESILQCAAALTWEFREILHQNMLEGECIDDYSLGTHRQNKVYSLIYLRTMREKLVLLCLLYNFKE